MDLFGLFRSPDINEGVKSYKATPNAILLDVRTAREYGEGHIPDSINLPLQSISSIDTVVKDRNTPIFIHCLSGGRSRQAAGVLGSMGYTNVKNIGGISAYRGEVLS